MPQSPRGQLPHDRTMHRTSGTLLLGLPQAAQPFGSCSSWSRSRYAKNTVARPASAGSACTKKMRRDTVAAP